MFGRVIEPIAGWLFDYLTDDGLEPVVDDIEDGTHYDYRDYDPRQTFVDVSWTASRRYILVPLALFGLISVNGVLYVLAPCVTVFPLQAYGLLFDIAGAIAVVLGLLRGKWGLLLDAGYGYLIGGSTLGGDAGERNFERLYRRACKDTVNVLYGVGFFVVGFSIQIISVLRPYSPVYLGC